MAQGSARGRFGLRTVRRHLRFFAAIAAGLATFAIAQASGLAEGFAPLVAADVLFATYLALSLPLLRLTPDDLRHRAEEEDAGAPLIFIIAVFTLAISLWAIFVALNREESHPVELALAFAALPLGWLTMNTLAAFHYAHLYYGRADEADRGGLEFPGDPTPDPVDFLYFAFCIGTSSQVSDVTVTRSELRAVVLVHGLAAFATNTVILALAVNAAAG